MPRHIFKLIYADIFGLLLRVFVCIDLICAHQAVRNGHLAKLSARNRTVLSGPLELI